MAAEGVRFFRAENANRDIAGVRFELVDVVAGTLIGVMAAEGELAAALDALLPANAQVIGEDGKPTGELVNEGKPEAEWMNPNALYEIDEAKYLELRQKKIPGLASSPHSNQLPFSETHLKGDGLVVLSSAPGEPGTPATGRILETAEEAVAVGKVKTEAPPEAPPKKSKKDKA